MTFTRTKTDIRKVFECFHADLCMLATRTGAMSPDEVDRIAHDVFVFAESRCLASVHIQLLNSSGVCINAHEYKPQENLLSNGDRPGGNSWPYQPKGNIEVFLLYSDIPAANRVKSAGNLLHFTWAGSSMSTDYSDMSADYSDMEISGSRQYASNGYGLTRATYRR